MAAGYSPLLIRPQSLVFYAPIIGRTSPEIDVVGGYDMTLYNGPTTVPHPRVIHPSTQIYKIPLAPVPPHDPRPSVAVPDIGGMISV